jgi:Flp pilus assembly protein TadG
VRLSKAPISAHDIATRFWRDRRGAVAVAVAVLLPVLIGFAGIGIEVGLWFWIQRQNQSAADAAAISAALEYAVQFEQPGMTTDPAGAATAAAGYSLFSNANCSTSGTTNCTLYPCYNFTVGDACNTSSSDGTLLNAVQVVLTQPLNTTFASLVTAVWGPSVNTVNVTTTAIAAFPMLPNGQTCLLAVGSSQTLSVGGSATLNLPNCTLASLSILGNSIQLPGSGNPAINAAAIATVGNVQMTDGSSPPPHTFTYFPLQDPYKNVTTTPLSGSIPSGPCNVSGMTTIASGTLTVPSTILYCGLTISGTANVTFSGGIYYIGAGGITINGSPTVNFGPGLYYIDGGTFRIAGSSGTASVTGSGITIVLTKINASSAGSIDIEGNACTATISLSGTQTGRGLLQPSATASQGLLFFQDPTAVNSFTPPFNVIANNCGTSNVMLNGAIYTPAGPDNLQGNASANFAGCTELIAQSFTFSGSLQLDDTNCSAVGITLNQAQIQQVYLAM